MSMIAFISRDSTQKGIFDERVSPRHGIVEETIVQICKSQDLNRYRREDGFPVPPPSLWTGKGPVPET